jgi:hypothetical protein
VLWPLYSTGRRWNDAEECVRKSWR